MEIHMYQAEWFHCMTWNDHLQNYKPLTASKSLAWRDNQSVYYVQPKPGLPDINYDLVLVGVAVGGVGEIKLNI